MAAFSPRFALLLCILVAISSLSGCTKNEGNQTDGTRSLHEAPSASPEEPFAEPQQDGPGAEAAPPLTSHAYTFEGTIDVWLRKPDGQPATVTSGYPTNVFAHLPAGTTALDATLEWTPAEIPLKLLVLDEQTQRPVPGARAMEREGHISIALPEIPTEHVELRIDAGDAAAGITWRLVVTVLSPSEPKVA